MRSLRKRASSGDVRRYGSAPSIVTSPLLGGSSVPRMFSRGALTRAGGPHDHSRLPRLQGERDLPQHDQLAAAHGKGLPDGLATKTCGHEDATSGEREGLNLSAPAKSSSASRFDKGGIARGRRTRGAHRAHPCSTLRHLDRISIHRRSAGCASGNADCLSGEIAGVRASCELRRPPRGAAIEVCQPRECHPPQSWSIWSNHEETGSPIRRARIRAVRVGVFDCRSGRAAGPDSDR